MKKVFNFGKIAYYDKKKINSVTVEIALKDTNSGPVFTASGNIWNSTHTDCLYCGQCLDEIANTSVGSNQLFKEIYRLWKAYHLNDMHIGTSKQEAKIKEWLELEQESYDFDLACEHLKKYNFYIDDGYRYGSGWLYEAIPEEDLNIIRTLLLEED